VDSGSPPVLCINNKVDATAQPTATLDIGGVDFPTAVLGQLEGELTFLTLLWQQRRSATLHKINSFLILPFNRGWVNSLKLRMSTNHN